MLIQRNMLFYYFYFLFVKNFLARNLFVIYFLIVKTPCQIT
jgi:hypothetical protein